MIKRFHEAPKGYFSKVQQLTDGDYALVHKFEDDEDYFKLFKNAVDNGREVILDNSLFELRTKFNPDRFAYWIDKLQPTYYIVPDVWKDTGRTIESFYNFVEKYSKNLPGKIMGVAQGNTIEETAICYQAMISKCDRIGLNLDYGNLISDDSIPYPVRMSAGRMKLIDALIDQEVIDYSKDHHLLGCGVPQELCNYHDIEYSFITSVDTCCPVMMGMCNQSIVGGIDFKLSNKMCDMLNYPYSEYHWKQIEDNIHVFEGFCNG